MSLSTPRPFTADELARLDRLGDRYAFASPVNITDGAPTVSHLPVLNPREGDRIRLCGHLARANPRSPRAGDALAMLHDPRACVSPRRYPDEADPARAPIGNHAVARLPGPVDPFDDRVTLAAHVAELAGRPEARASGDGRLAFDAPAELAQLRGIVGFRPCVERVEMKFKLNQKHPDANRRAVAGRLGRGDAMAREVACLMHATLED